MNVYLALAHGLHITIINYFKLLKCIYYCECAQLVGADNHQVNVNIHLLNWWMLKNLNTIDMY